LVFDGQYLKNYSFANRPAGSEAPQSVPRANGLAELAAKLGIDGHQLVEEVARFNGFARQGRDEDFHRGENQWKLAKTASGANTSLGTIEEPPSYGVELHPTGAASVGLLANGHAQVMHQRRHHV